LFINILKEDVVRQRITILLIAITIITGSTLGQESVNVHFIDRLVDVKFDGVRKYVEIKWRAINERGFNYYILQRSIPDSIYSTDTDSWKDIARIDTGSTTDSIKSYGYMDYPSVIASYGYRVKIIFNGGWATIGIGEVSASLLTGVSTFTDQDIPLEYASVRNYPNPFNPTTNIVLKLQTAEKGSLDIFDLNGRKLESLANGSLPAGTHQYKWDATKYPSGIYFCVLRTQKYTSTAKLVLQK
jgi:hypothetical protein